jgi:hypothetical protein
MDRSCKIGRVEVGCSWLKGNASRTSIYLRTCWLLKKTPGWTDLLRKQGPNYLAWLAQNKVLTAKFNDLATALWRLLQSRISTPEDACEIWRATPGVLRRCNEQSTYQMPGATVAYAWLYLLDRYARTWLALEKLVASSCLPLAKFGVRTLDVGTGPGPSAFAVCDFYAALTEFGRQTDIELLQQPPAVTCVERDLGNNMFRHHLAEVIFQQSGHKSEHMLALCGALPDFGKLMPTEERNRLQLRLRRQEDEYYNEVTQHWDAYPMYSATEANKIAQSRHRYKMIVFSNFLTTVGTVADYEPRLSEILSDAQTGSVVMVLGGKGGQYSKIYKYVDRLAKAAGFQLKMKAENVSSAETEVADQVFNEGARVYELLQALAQDTSKDTKVVRDHFASHRQPAPTSQMWAYRKYKHGGGRSASRQILATPISASGSVTDQSATAGLSVYGT